MSSENLGDVIGKKTAKLVWSFFADSRGCWNYGSECNNQQLQPRESCGIHIFWLQKYHNFEGETEDSAGLWWQNLAWDSELGSLHEIQDFWKTKIVLNKTIILKLSILIYGSESCTMDSEETILGYFKRKMLLKIFESFCHGLGM